MLHDAPGGISETTLDLLSFLGAQLDAYLLEADPHRVSLLRYRPERHDLQPLRDWWLATPWSGRAFMEPEHRRIYAEVLRTVEIDLVHIRHLLGHTFDIVELCRQLRLPIVLSFHDYYLLCPSIHLLDDTGTYCGGQCTPTRGQCRLPLDWLSDLPVLKQGHLQLWRQQVARSFESISSFVTTSSGAAEVITRAFPELRQRDLRIIEHGRDLAARPSFAAPPASGEPIRLLLPGHLRFHKGSRFIRELKEIDREHRDRLELHFVGTIDPELRGLGRYHGKYARADLPRYAARIRPSFVGLFSVWPETYSHTLTEAWALGVPALVSDLGALPERIQKHGGGWILPVADATASYRRILEISDDPVEYERQRSLATAEGLPSIADMGAAYRRLYDELLGKHRHEPP